MIIAPTSGRTFNAYNTTNGWTETGITWTNQPAEITQQGSGVSTGTTNGVWLTFNVTNATKASYAQANHNMSIMIRDSVETGSQYNSQFASKENATASGRPQLIITFVNNCSSFNLTTYNESSTSQSVTFNLVASNATSSFSRNDNFFYCNSSFLTGAVTIAISNTSFYSPRYYYSTLTAGGSYNLNAYLLPYSDIDYIQTTILIKNALGNTVPGAVVTIQKMIGSAYTTVAQDTVDGVGQVFFTLDKGTEYYLIANATGYDTTTMYFQPSQIQYTVTISGNINYNIWDNSTSGIYWNVTPGSYRLTGLQHFNFSILDANNSLGFWGMSINYNGTQLYFSNQTASAGGSVNYSVNVSNYPGSINMTIFFKRVNGTFFDPIYPYWGYSIVASNNSLVNAMANVGSSNLDPLTKSLLALLVITVVVGYVGSQNFTGGVLLSVVMMWGFASFGFLSAILVSMLTIIGLSIIILKYFPTG